MVDVYVPSMGQTYDFSLDETARVEDITDRKLFPAGMTVKACGIQNAAHLILI